MGRNITFAVIGWVAGVISTVVLGLLWPIIFPAIINVENYYGAGPSLAVIIGIVLLFVTPASIIGGLVGGRLAREGGERGQRLLSIIFGITLATPCGCMGYWFFTGF
jgi:hypothetical protein